jgi:hypothetical protein
LKREEMLKDASDLERA